MQRFEEAKEHDGIQRSGEDLVRAARHLPVEDGPAARAIAFEVARATRGGEEWALDALRALVIAAAAAPALDDGAITNIISGLQFALAASEADGRPWAPPPEATQRILMFGYNAGPALRLQAEGLVRALLDDQALAARLGVSDAELIATRARSPLARSALPVRAADVRFMPPSVEGGAQFSLFRGTAAQAIPRVRTRDLEPVASGGEFPCLST